MFPSGAGLIFTDLPPSGRYGECGRALRFARALLLRCGVDRGVRSCRDPIATHSTDGAPPAGRGTSHPQSSASSSPTLPDIWRGRGPGHVFPDPGLVAAIVDRVTFNAHILETGTQSYRLRTSKATTRRKKTT